MYRKTNGGTRSESGDRIYEKLTTASYTSGIRKSNKVKDWPPEIKKWMGKKYLKRLRRGLIEQGKKEVNLQNTNLLQ